MDKIRSDIGKLTDAEFRQYVVGSLHRIEAGLTGIESDPNNRGVVGAVDTLCRRVEYVETTQKREVFPRIQKIEKAHEVHMATQTAWRNGLTFALGIATAMLGVAGGVLLFG